MGDSQDQDPRSEEAGHESADDPDASGVNETPPRAGAAPAGRPGQAGNPTGPPLSGNEEGPSTRSGPSSVGPPNGGARTENASTAPRTGSSAGPAALTKGLSRVRLAGLLRDGPPFGPTRPGFWRSPLRGPWLTSVLGAVLLVGITLLFVTGLLSYAAYNPDLGANDKTPDRGWLGFYLFSWPTHPYWLYRLTQGVHVTLGIVLIPVLLAKLWSVIPKLFSWPPVKSVSHALERLSLLLLVGGVLFEFATGVLNIQLDYIFPGSFYPCTSTGPGSSSAHSSSISPSESRSWSGCYATADSARSCGDGPRQVRPHFRIPRVWSLLALLRRPCPAGARWGWWGPAPWCCLP